MNRYPIISESKYLSDKDIDFRLYLISVFNSYHNNEGDSDEIFLSPLKLIESKGKFLEIMDISSKTFDRAYSKFLNSSLVSVENEIIKIRVKNEELKKYVLLYEEELEKLLTLPSNEIKLYITLRYLKGKSKRNYPITRAALETDLGMTRKTIDSSLKKLEEKGFLEYEIKKTETIKNLKIVKTNSYKYSLPVFNELKTKYEKLVNFNEYKDNLEAIN